MAKLERPDVDVQLFTVERVESILREASIPVSRAYIHAALARRKAGTTPARLNRVLDYLMRLEMVVEGSKGVQWTFSGSPRLRYGLMYGKAMV